jgi:hypothetical protein
MRGKIIKQQLILSTGSERPSNTWVRNASVRPIEAGLPDQASDPTLDVDESN